MQIDKATYKASRKLIRENGRAALNWMDLYTRSCMVEVVKLERGHDPLAEREDYANYCKRGGQRVTANSLKLAIRADKVVREVGKTAELAVWTH